MTDRLILNKIIAKDINNIYEGLSHPDVIKYYGVSYNTIEETEEQMKWFEDSSQYWWIISSKKNHEFCGAAGLNDICTKSKKAEIGLWLLPNFWGKGIMKEVLPAICTFAFDSLNLHRIEGFVESKNKKCKSAMAKLNFAYEGTMKECEIKNGEFISVDIYALLNQNK